MRITAPKNEAASLLFMTNDDFQRVRLNGSAYSNSSYLAKVSNHTCEMQLATVWIMAYLG